ncbi:divergent polysaccharide deacetylase family protein [Maricaulis sp.]|uniref:divergent polysaccharide deacetylase family protein n=1 Tax=Maricaulis sp. TaxID=1486257 RepID=UPI0026294269|nr:divergent polysaccharide deacetylase family protein [Maricaulis sp.]
MRRRNAHPLRRVLQSATPAMASVVVAAAYGLGAIVFSIASADATSDLPDRTLIDFAAFAGDGTTERTLERPAERLAERSGSRTVTYARSVPPTARASEIPAPAIPAARPRIALVIDDVGLDLAAVDRLADLPVPLTSAILPYAEHSVQVAREMRQAGHDVLVHMPMEPVGLADPGPNALRIGLSEADIEARILWGLARVPGAVGINNHMGSRFTRDAEAMRLALSAVPDEAGLFLDSVTTSQSRGALVARGLGLNVLERDLFLDHVQDASAIEARLADAEALAELRGWALVIGHPHDVTLDALEAWIDGAQARGIDFITVSELVQHTRPDQPQAQIQASIR